jgi:hypothetical protein
MRDMAKPKLRAIEWDGKTWNDPSATRLHDLLADMNMRCRFVIVERLSVKPLGQHYMQVYLNDDYSYQIEFREGGPDRHFQALIAPRPELDRVEPVARILQDWAISGSMWRTALPWRPWHQSESDKEHERLTPAKSAAGEAESVSSAT